MQMSGGDFSMDFDQEKTYYKAYCMEYDIKAIFQMISDCALEERSPMAINVFLLIKNKIVLYVDC